LEISEEERGREIWRYYRRRELEILEGEIERYRERESE